MDRFEFDDDYVRRLKEGDRETEEHFFVFFRSLLPIILRRMSLSDDAIDDVIQETLIRVVVKARLGEIRDGRTLGSYVVSTARNVARERKRKESHFIPLEETHLEIADPYDELDRLIKKEDVALVHQILDSLEPKRDAEILEAIFLRDETRDAVCRRFNVDHQYLRVLLHRALKNFRNKLRR